MGILTKMKCFCSTRLTQATTKDKFTHAESLDSENSIAYKKEKNN